MSLCEQEASQAIIEGRDGPLCLESGNYSPQQCDSNRLIKSIIKFTLFVMSSTCSYLNQALLSHLQNQEVSSRTLKVFTHVNRQSF